MSSTKLYSNLSFLNKRILFQFIGVWSRDINEPFYNSLESSFEEACKLIKEEKLEKEYRGECRRLMNETYHFGWGLYDGMKYSYETYFSQ